MFLILLVGGIHTGTCQNTAYDTIIVKKSIKYEVPEIDTILVSGGLSTLGTDILVGTTFLPYTDRWYPLMDYQLNPQDLSVVSECSKSIERLNQDDYPLFHRAELDSSNLTIEVSIISNCCDHFLGEAEVVGGDTLNLMYHAYGGNCGCNCCFTLQYRFNYWGKEEFPLHHVTINGSMNKAAIVQSP